MKTHAIIAAKEDERRNVKPGWSISNILLFALTPVESKCLEENSSKN